MTTISNNLEELNKQKRGLTINAETLLQQLGFVVTGKNDITLSVTLPAGWTEENLGRANYEKGSFHTVFRGPNNEEIWSFVKHDPLDRRSFLHARGIGQMKGEK